MLKLVLLLSRGIVRDRQARRQWMFYTLLAAMLMVFLGTVGQSWLRERVWVLLFFWAGCAALTLLAALLAIFDLLMLRLAARAARRELEQQYLREKNDDESAA